MIILKGKWWKRRRVRKLRKRMDLAEMVEEVEELRVKKGIKVVNSLGQADWGDLKKKVQLKGIKGKRKEKVVNNIILEVILQYLP